jgi:hypothetical protein
MEKFRPWLAEFVGTFALIFVGIGAIKTAGHDVLGIALAHGLTIAVFASASAASWGGSSSPLSADRRTRPRGAADPPVLHAFASVSIGNGARNSFAWSICNTGRAKCAAR